MTLCLNTPELCSLLLTSPMTSSSTIFAHVEIMRSTLKAKKMLRGLKVVNDAVEHGVALIQSFNSVITNQEEQKQYLLQVVEKHRLFFPNANKSTLLRH